MRKLSRESIHPFLYEGDIIKAIHYPLSFWNKTAYQAIIHYNDRFQIWFSGPFPCPSLRFALIAPVTYSLAAVMLSLISIPFARLQAMAEDKVQPVP